MLYDMGKTVVCRVGAAFKFASWVAGILLILVFMIGCSYTNSPFITVKQEFGRGDWSKVEGVETRVSPIDKSTQGPVSSAHTISPSATVPVMP